MTAGSSPLARLRTLSWQTAWATVWRLVVSTVGTCMRNRVTGLAAEAAFFAVLSLPPLVFALAGSIGYVFAQFSDSAIAEVRQTVINLSSQALTPQVVNSIIRPTLDEVLRGGRYDVVSIGFILALWSGSRALNVFVDTITIMYGLGGQRGIVPTRALSFLLYVLGMVTGVVTIPLVVAGPTLIAEWLPQRVDFLNQAYWPTVLVLGIVFLATLYHVSVPVRMRWRYNVPGAVFTMFCWVFGSALLRLVLVETAANSTSIYGPLASPIAVLLWLYLLSIAVLIGAALNAAFDQVWPQKELTTARLERLKKLKLDNVLPWRQSLERAASEEERSAEASDPAADSKGSPGA
ncbi:MAG TPA: YihY/virulence factor BrkB family protein [Marmoricola sp.]|nr:YihY/virulence factor BrkB family protein [Marmoricola sp.]